MNLFKAAVGSHPGRFAGLENVDVSQFKAAMRCIASTVSVITSGEGDSYNGMTATAVCSVSAMPPSVLIVVNQDNRSHALIEKTGAFAINILSSRQKSIALHFASKPADPFGSISHHVGITNSPILDEGVTYLECVVESQMKSGTHSIFVGRVVASGQTDRRPLTYHNGEFVSSTEERAGGDASRRRRVCK
jgi:flavin reductase (DIM6/NTAB) family NADH-FMN oxidoreductase RutF